MTAASSYAMTLLDVLWRHSCSVAILVALVLVARSIAFRGPAAQWRTALWALVLARLLVPVVPSSRLSIANIGDWLAHARHAWQARHPAVAQIGASPALPSSEQIVRRGYLPADALPVAALLPAPAADRSSWPLALGAAWVIGAVWVIARRVVSHARFVRRLKREPIITEGPLADLLTRACEQMGIRRRPALRLTTAVTTPALVGLVRPQLLIPPSTASSLAPAQLRLVLLHELAHLRRGDLWIDLVATLLVAVHWFNPFVWLAAALYRADRELARDAMVLRAAGEGEAQAYGRTIVLLLEQLALTGPATPAGGVGILERWSGVRQRVYATVARQQIGAARAAVALLSVVLVGCCGLTSRQRGADRPTTAPVAVTTPAEEPGDSASVRAWLARDVGQLDLDGKRLSDVVATLSEAAGGADIIVDWPAVAKVGVTRESTVCGRLRHTTLEKALRELAASVLNSRARLAVATVHGVILISTEEDIDAASATTRTYEIKDLLVDVPDFDDVPTLGAAPATAPADPPPAELSMTRRERTDAIIKLVRETVDPPSWDKIGATIRDDSDRLVIRQTPGNHEQIARLLGQLRETRGLQITVAARFLSVDDLDATLRSVGLTLPGAATQALVPGTYLDGEQVGRLLKAAEAGRGVTSLSTPRITLFNGQRAYVMMATETAYVSELKAVAGPGGAVRYEPQTASFSTGNVLDVQATVSSDRKYVTMTLRPQISQLEGMETVPSPAGAPRAADVPQVHRPKLYVGNLKTTVSVPNGGTLFLAGFPPVGPASATRRQIFLLVRPTIVRERHERVKSEP